MKMKLIYPTECHLQNHLRLVKKQSHRSLLHKVHPSHNCFHLSHYQFLFPAYSVHSHHALAFYLVFPEATLPGKSLQVICKNRIVQMHTVSDLVFLTLHQLL